MSSTKVIGSIYFQLGLGVFLTGTMLIASGCNSGAAAPNLNQKLYATNGNSVVVFTPPANTTVNVAPTLNITGALTGLDDPHRTAIDAKGNIYVTNFNGTPSVSIFAAGATGNVAPTATISGANTGLDGPSGIALDSAGKIYVANSDSNSITVYAAGATGNATPTVTIYGTNTGLQFPNGLALDSTGKIYVANEDASTITVYAANPTYTPGKSTEALVSPQPSMSNVLNEAPVATISGTNTGLSCPHALALDATSNIYAVNGGCDSGGSVTVYAASATGNATPTATISGKNTNFDDPNGISLDDEGDIYVGNHNAVEVYAAKPTGSVTTAPVYTLTGTTTGLNGIHGVTVN